MRIYTRTGDAGETGLFSGARVSKDAARVEAYGAVDEANSYIGLIRSEQLDGDIDNVLMRVQRTCFHWERIWQRRLKEGGPTRYPE